MSEFGIQWLKDETVLPDYPRAKTEIDKRVLKMITRKRDPLLSEIKESPLHEGNRARMVRSDGSQDEISFSQHQANINFKYDEYGHLQWKDVMERVENAGKEMTASVAKQLFEELDEVTKQTGNRLDVHGAFTPQGLFETLRKLYIDCDDKGNIKMPSFYCGREAEPAVRKVLEEIQKDPRLMKELDSIMAEKKGEWRDRETNRKLVG